MIHRVEFDCLLKDEVLIYYQRGHTPKEIAEFKGVTPDYVRNQLYYNQFVAPQHCCYQCGAEAGQRCLKGKHHNRTSNMAPGADWVIDRQALQVASLGLEPPDEYLRVSVEDSLKVACDDCGVDTGQRCRNPNGRLAREPHVARMDLFEIIGHLV